MKKLLLIPVLLVVLLLSATPVFAGDPPPGTEVDVTVVTPGDVDLDVGINAGGDVDITIDGAKYPPDNSLSGGAWGQGDVLSWWGVESQYIQATFRQMQHTIDLLAVAGAKLISEQALTVEELEELDVALDEVANLVESTDASINALQESTETSIVALQSRDTEIWNQLMYGAEAHIVILEDRVDSQETEISELQSQTVALSNDFSARLEASRVDYANLLNYVDYLQKQYLYYFWILGGVAVALAIIGLVWVKIFRRPHF